MTDKANGSRLKLYVMDGGAEKLVTEQVDLQIDRSVDAMPVTSFDIGPDAVFIPGMRTAGVTFSFIMDAAAITDSTKINHTRLAEIEQARLTKEWRVKLAGAATPLLLSFPAFISEFSTAGPMESKILCDITLTRGLPTDIR